MIKIPISLFAFILVCLLSNRGFGQVVGEYLFSNEIDEKVKTEKNYLNLQNLAVQFSLSGNYKDSLALQKTFVEKRAEKGSIKFRPELKPTFKQEFKPINAVKAIAEEAEKYQVVITNEAHYQPQNRVFSTVLLQALYDKGFRYFAFEDFTPDDKIAKTKTDNELNSRKYALKSTGYYIAEPQYGNLVREAIRLGFKIVPYEHYASDLTDPIERLFGRERGQAKNIAAIIKENPNAKVVVHCGYGHLNETFNEDGVGQMGGYLKNEFKLDPLTIDQENLLEENFNPYSNVFSVKEPSVFINSQNAFFSNSYSNVQGKFNVDISVVFPKTKYINGRPNWLMYPKNRKYFFVKSKDLKIAFPVMILAYHKGEDLLTAIPSDVIELNSGKERKALVLTKGHYVLLIKNPKGEEQKIEIWQN